MTPLRKKTNRNQEVCSDKQRYKPRGDIASFTDTVRAMSRASLLSLLSELGEEHMHLGAELSAAKRAYNRVRRMSRIVSRTLDELDKGYVGNTSRWCAASKVMQYRLPAVLCGDVSPTLHEPVLFNERGNPAGSFTLEFRFPQSRAKPVKDIFGELVRVPSVNRIQTQDLPTAISVCSMGADPVRVRLQYFGPRRRELVAEKLNRYWVGDLADGP